MTTCVGPDGRRMALDAVVVIPGIMGSELVDEASGDTVWGLKPAVLAKAWISNQVKVLHVTEPELQGERRLRPTRLLRVPAWAPFLKATEPYHKLLDTAATNVIDPRAAIEFPYDWRLSITYNAAELVKHCEKHLQAWRAVVKDNRYCDPNDVRLVLIAHSMGGLIARLASAAPEMVGEVRDIVTLGTPYFGAVKAVQMLATGEGAPVPARAAQQLALTCPGVYDLLPRYACLEEVNGPRQLTVADLVDMTSGRHASLTDDAIRELAGESEVRWRQLRLMSSDTAVNPEPKALVGSDQPTLQGVALKAGEVTFTTTLGGADDGGDSTVYRKSAHPLGVTAFPLPQSHGALTKADEALRFVKDKLLERDTGLPLALRPVGAEIPDVVDAGAPVSVRVTGVEEDPGGVSVESTDVTTNQSYTWPEWDREGADVRYSYEGLPPGLHRISVQYGGYSAVTDILLAVEVA